MAPDHKRILAEIDAGLDIEADHAPAMYRHDEGRLKVLRDDIFGHAKRASRRPKPFQLKIKEPAGIAAAERGR